MSAANAASILVVYFSVISVAVATGSSVPRISSEIAMSTSRTPPGFSLVRSGFGVPSPASPASAAPTPCTPPGFSGVGGVVETGSNAAARGSSVGGAYMGILSLDSNSRSSSAELAMYLVNSVP